ncbi:MAG: D-alanyl-D-alanine carboxypeptidase [Alphaproteobacteria bacterium]|nr:D-alanyl-D-alanine carboxypeptidase [Alphaproteobacteria bacterium]
MTRARASFLRTAFTFVLGALVWAVNPAMAGVTNDAALVMDAESGRVLYARSGDALRSPASLTKMMTLYILFDYIKAGRIGLNDEMPVSAHAASQDPSKLGLKKGDTLTAQQAIYALVIKSANDAAVVVAEYIGGSEGRFAQMMTQRARELGMRRTQYRNASGLPDEAQLTTARDLAILSRSMMRNHPRLFDYFRVTAFTWKGKTIKTHNRVLTSLNGANGIKTGYTKASGFNLTTSAERNGKRLIGVVLGGDTWKARDDEMKAMLEAWFAQLERRPNLIATYGSGTTFAEAAPVQAVAVVAPPAEAKVAIVPAAAAAERRIVARAEDAAPVTESRRALTMAPIPDEPAPAKRKAVTVAYHVPTPVAKPTRVASVADRKVKMADAKAKLRRGSDIAEEQGDGAEDDEVAVATTKMAKDDVLPLNTLVSNDSDDIAQLIDAGYSKAAAKKRGATAGAWGIQIGAFDSKKAAQAELDRARKTAKAKLAKADDGVTTVTNEAGRTFYRARFVDLGHDEAQAACSALKAKSFKCVTFSTATADAS